MYLSVSSLAQWCSMYLLHRLLPSTFSQSTFYLPPFLFLNCCLNISPFKSSCTKNFLFLSPPLLLFSLSLYLCFSSPPFFFCDPHLLLPLPSSLLLLALPLGPSSRPIFLFFLSIYRSYSSLALEVDRPTSIHSQSYYASCSPLFSSIPIFSYPYSISFFKCFPLKFFLLVSTASIVPPLLFPILFSPLLFDFFSLFFSLLLISCSTLFLHLFLLSSFTVFSFFSPPSKLLW
jgi:hypothetical protein